MQIKLHYLQYEIGKIGKGKIKKYKIGKNEHLATFGKVC